MSRVGKLPIHLDKAVKASVADSTLKVEGPKGKLELKLHPGFTVEIKDSEIVVKRPGDTSEERRQYNEQSVAVGARVQEEDLGICEAVQRGLKSRAYGAGRLSVRREAGEHLFHRLLAADLKSGPSTSAIAAD